MILRPHHLLCNYCFIGEGYSDLFIENFKQINAQLTKNPEQKIQIQSHLDSICQFCPHQKGEKCEMEKKVQKIDMLHKKVLSLQENQVLTWQDAVERIQKYIDLTTFKEICSSCQWYSLGICAQQLQAKHLKK